MRLVDIYDNLEGLTAPRLSDLRLLYLILGQRDETTSISHRDMPDWGSHVRFVLSRPYAHWWIIEVESERVGAIYLSKQNELGVFILKGYQGKGYGPKAMQMVIDMYPGVAMLSNVNPRNDRSARMLERLGFVEIQRTYRLALPPSKGD